MTRLRLLRFERGLEQTAVAAQVGISREWLSALELGKADLSAPVAKSLADFYGITVSELLGLDAAADAGTAGT
jgi:transcriptional regulator with XRE-family HTH domain